MALLQIFRRCRQAQHKHLNLGYQHIILRINSHQGAATGMVITTTISKKYNRRMRRLALMLSIPIVASMPRNKPMYSPSFFMSSIAHCPLHCNREIMCFYSWLGCRADLWMDGCANVFAILMHANVNSVAIIYELLTE